jgi:hypothetical protein
MDTPGRIGGNSGHQNHIGPILSRLETQLGKFQDRELSHQPVASDCIDWWPAPGAKQRHGHRTPFLPCPPLQAGTGEEIRQVEPRASPLTAGLIRQGREPESHFRLPFAFLSFTPGSSPLVNTTP